MNTFPLPSLVLWQSDGIREFTWKPLKYSLAFTFEIA
jgi:hypothetical protein